MKSEIPIDRNKGKMTKKKQKSAPSEKSEMAFAIELARGASVIQAAKKVRIAESTGYRWSRKPEVLRAVQEIRSTVLRTVSYRMSNLTGLAVDTLEELLRSENDKIRLSAAKTVIEGTVKMRQLAELEQELEQIREFVATLREQNR